MRLNAYWNGYKRLRKWHFLSLEDLFAFCESMGIAEEEIEIYVVED